MKFSDEQAAVRRLGIGGSEIAAVVGLPSFSAPIEVWRSKTDPDFQKEETFRMEVGTLVEPVVIQLLVKRTDWNLELGLGTVKHPLMPLICTPDALVSKPGALALVEAKTASKWAMADWGSDGSDVVPKQYVVQCQHNMFVLRARGFQVSEALVPVLVDLSEFRIYRVPYAHDVASALAKQACLWWEKHVVGKRPPPPDGTPSYQDYLDTAYPKPQRGAEIVAPSEMTRWAANYQEAHAAKKQAERQLREAEQQLCIALGEAESIVGDGWRASWRPNKNGDRRFRFQGATDEG